MCSEGVSLTVCKGLRVLGGPWHGCCVREAYRLTRFYLTVFLGMQSETHFMGDPS